MCKLITICACIIAVLAFVSVRSDHGSDTEYIGQMPTVVVTAARSGVDTQEWSGLMDTVFVSAPRHDRTDVAWSGLLDTVTAIETPYRPVRGSTMPTLTYRGFLDIIADDYHYRVE